MTLIYITTFTLLTISFFNLVGKYLLRFFKLQNKIPFFSFVHTLLIGISATLCIASILSSVEVKFSQLLLIGFPIALFIMILNRKNKKNRILRLRFNIANNINKEFFMAMILSLFSMLVGNINYFTKGYRTNGNNDPYDYLMLSRVYESPKHNFINLHVGWSEYSDRAGPFTTRLISVIQDVLPGNRYIDFLVFVCITYFLFTLSIITFLRIMNLKLISTILPTLIILFSPTYKYIFQQGFFQQIWGLLLLTIFIAYVSTLLKSDNSRLPPSDYYNLFFIFLFYLLLIFLSYFIFFIFIGAVFAITFSFLLLETLKSKNLRNLSINFVKRRRQSKLFWTHFIFIVFTIFYFYFFLLRSIQLNVAIFNQVKEGAYGWSRPFSEYFFGNGVVFPVLDGLIFILALVFLLIFALGGTFWDVFCSVLTLLMAVGFIYFGLHAGFSVYQTWKYFSFVFLFTLLFLFSKLSEFSRVYLQRFSDFDLIIKYFSFLVVVWIWVFLSQPGLQATVNATANPPLSLVSSADIQEIPTLRNLDSAVVGIYLGSVGETMLISSLVPSKSVLIFSDSYYGKPAPKAVNEMDYLLTNVDLVKSLPGCDISLFKQVAKRYLLLKINPSNISCYSKMLEDFVK